MRQADWPRGRSAAKDRRPAGRPAFLCAVDPGSTVVRVLLVALGAETPTVWGWGEAPAGSPGADLGRLVRGIETALDQAEEDAQVRLGSWTTAPQMVVGLPASHLRGWSWPISQRRPQPQRAIDEREQEALLGRALRLSVSRLTEPHEAGWRILEATPAALSVDGHGVTDLVGFRGAEIGARVFAALAKASVIEAWRQVAERLGFEVLTITAAPVALAASLPETQGMVLDVGGHSTQLTWGRAGHAVGIACLGTGGNVLTELLLNKWGMTPDRAETLKRTFAEGRLAASARQQVREVIAPGLNAWFATVEEALAGMSERADEPLPHQVFLCGGGSALGDLTETLRRLAWSQRLAFERYPQVDAFLPGAVRGVVNRTDGGRAPGDESSLALAAWAGRQAERETRPRRLLKKLCEA